MTKAELIASVARSTGQTKATVEQVLAYATDHIQEALSRGEKVLMLPFGIFTVKSRPARSGRNPKTGETIDISERKVIKFKPAKGLEDRLAQAG